MSEPNSKHQEQDGRTDFDFFIGSWKFRNRCLREWLKGSTSWEEFGGASVARKILGGLGHIEEYTLEYASGAREGLAIRLFDPQTQQWGVYEADTNGFDPRPVIGAFKDGRIEGYSHQSWEGKYIFRRVIWSEITAISFHWEQAFSADGGKTWETNWIADFVRSD
ncbi:MAG TPA: DUF1579 domain-containing protein [Ktedonobacterales bacterium]